MSTADNLLRVVALSRRKQSDADEKMRISIAGRIAAGMCANPACMEMRNWQGEIAFNALSVADKLISLVRSDF